MQSKEKIKSEQSKSSQPNNWVELPTESLIIAEYNPRSISSKKLEMLKKSITEDADFLQIRPLIVNTYPGRENIVVGGNQRLLAARELGLETVPAILVELDPVKEKLWNIKDNSGYGEWENDLLKEIFIELKDEDIDLELTGFEESEVASIVDEPDTPPEMDEDEESLEPAKSTKIKVGDVIQVGNHYIMCGDSTKKEDVDRLFESAGIKEASLLVTSPPYGVGIEYEVAGIDPLKKVVSGFIRAFNDKSNTWVINFANIRCAQDGWQFDSSNLTNSEMLSNGYHLLDSRIWKKPRNYGTAPYWLHSYKAIDDWEFINIYQKKKKFVERLSKAENDEWGYAGVWEMTNSAGAFSESSHPAKFPIILPFRVIQMLSDEGDYVIDPFGGAMTTLLACEKLNRKALMMELDPKYIESALMRIRKYYPDIEVTSSGEI